MNFFRFVLIAFLFKVFDTLVAFLAPRFIFRANQFSYNDKLQPDFLDAFANFDGIHYLDIAKRGYLEPGEFAFFPLYPLVIRLVQNITLNNYYYAGILISFVSLSIGLFYFCKYLKLLNFTRNQIIWTFVFLLTFPTSFYFNAVYTESFFFMIIILALYFLKQKKYWLSFLFSFLAPITRLVGLFLFVSSFLHVLIEKARQKWIIIAPFIGLAVFSGYFWITYNDPLRFISAQKEMGEQRADLFILFPQVLYRYIKIFITANWNFQYFIAAVEFVIFGIFLAILFFSLTRNAIKRKDLYITGTLGLFSLINLILPTMTGSLSSIPRYALMSLYVFLFLGKLKATWLKVSIAVLFFIFHLVLLGFFVQGYFVS